MGFLDVIPQLRKSNTSLSCILLEKVDPTVSELCNVRHEHCNPNNPLCYDATLALATFWKSLLW